MSLTLPDQDRHPAGLRRAPCGTPTARARCRRERTPPATMKDGSNGYITSESVFCASGPAPRTLRLSGNGFTSPTSPPLLGWRSSVEDFVGELGEQPLRVT